MSGFLGFTFHKTCGIIQAHNISKMVPLHIIFIFPFQWWSNGWSCSWQNGAGGHEQVNLHSEPGCLPPSDHGAIGHWHVLHRLVLPLRAYCHQEHLGFLQRAPQLLGGLALHGFVVLFLLLWVSIYIWPSKGSNQVASLNPYFCKLIYYCWKCPSCFLQWRQMCGKKKNVFLFTKEHEPLPIRLPIF